MEFRDQSGIIDHHKRCPGSNILPARNSKFRKPPGNPSSDVDAGACNLTLDE
jgi:hypothetical protein